MDDHRLNAESRIQNITEPPLLEPSKRGLPDLSPGRPLYVRSFA